MGYSVASTIVNDAAAELGLGTSPDVYGSTDANFIQLRTLLKNGGRDLTRKRNWTHLIKEYSFVTLQNWEASTAYTAAAAAWVGGTVYAVDAFVTNNSNLYQCTTAGTAFIAGTNPGVALGPQSTETEIADGTCVWTYLNAGSASIVVNGPYSYTCSTTGTSGSVGPVAIVSGSAENDNTVSWSYLGRASDYALPSDFGDLIDQTGWNRTNALPVGGPLDGQMWQYLKGRSQGVVFNVFFRPTAGVMRLYPDTDTPGGQSITFEYASSYWVLHSGSSATAAEADEPTANGDTIYFDPLLMVRRIKLDWLGNKGFSTERAQAQYDDALESVINADSPAPVLNLRGRGPYDPLIGAQNVPITDFGS